MILKRYELRTTNYELRNTKYEIRKNEIRKNEKTKMNPIVEIADFFKTYDEKKEEIMFEKQTLIDKKKKILRELSSINDEIVNNNLKKKNLNKSLYIKSYPKSLKILNSCMETKCFICYEDYSYSESCWLSCNHEFCKVCIKNWFGDNKKKSCPICRRYPEVIEIYYKEVWRTVEPVLK